MISEMIEADRNSQWTTSALRAAGVELQECNLKALEVRFGPEVCVYLTFRDLGDKEWNVTFETASEVIWDGFEDSAEDRPSEAAGEIFVARVQDDFYELDTIDGRLTLRASSAYVQESI